jgi:hypothetical protein
MKNGKATILLQPNLNTALSVLTFSTRTCLRNASQIRVRGGQRNNAHAVATTQLRIVHHGGLPPRTSTSYAVLLENSSHGEKSLVLVLMIMIRMGHNGMQYYFLDFWRNCVGWV